MRRPSVNSRTLRGNRCGFLRLLGIGLMMACSSSATSTNQGNGIVQVRTDHVSYSPGAVVVLTITNKGDTNVGYGLCPSALERQVAASWSPVRSYEPGDCDLVLRILIPGGSGQTSTRLPLELPVGNYRLRFDSLAEQGRPVLLPLESRVSNVFAIK